MKNRCRINYIFLLLSFGIVSTILATPISAQTQNNSQNQTPETEGSSPYTSGKPGIESATEMEGITNDTQTSISNDTTSMMQELGKETQAGEPNSRRTTREPNSRRTTREPNSRRTTREPNSRRTTREPNSRRTTREPNSRRTTR